MPWTGRVRFHLYILIPWALEDTLTLIPPFLSGSESATLMGCGRLQPFAVMTVHFEWLKLVKNSGTHARPTADRWDSAEFFLSAVASLLSSIGTDGRPALGFAAETQEQKETDSLKRQPTQRRHKQVVLTLEDGEVQTLQRSGKRCEGSNGDALAMQKPSYWAKTLGTEIKSLSERGKCGQIASWVGSDLSGWHFFHSNHSRTRVGTKIVQTSEIMSRLTWRRITWHTRWLVFRFISHVHVGKIKLWAWLDEPSVLPRPWVSAIATEKPYVSQSWVCLYEIYHLPFMIYVDWCELRSWK